MARRRTFWWEDDPTERFWMETIARPQFGDTVKAPHKRGSGGTDMPFHATVDLVRDGDVVLHWATGRNRRVAGFVGYSIVDGYPFAVDAVDYEDAQPFPGREALLRDYTEFRDALTLTDLLARRDTIFAIKQSLKARHQGALYFPFDPWGGGREIRVHQGAYLAKFPAALFEVLPELTEACRHDRPRLDVAVAAEPPTEPRIDTRLDRRRARESGDVGDVALRRAIETQALAQARALYEAEGSHVTDLGASRPFDLRVSPVAGLPARQVIVSGSTDTVEHLDLSIDTIDELPDVPTDVVLVHKIPWERTGRGVTTTDGTLQSLRNWRPSISSLAPVRFRYSFGA